MSLGFARDSILDLASMAKEHDEGKGGSGSGDFSSQSSLNDKAAAAAPAPASAQKKGHGGIHHQYDDQPAPQAANASDIGLVLGGPPSQSSGISTSGGSTLSRVGSASSMGSASSAAGESTSSASGKKQGAYSAFAYDYSAYADYYDEADAWMGDYTGKRATATEQKNVFCCLLAPWRPRPDSGDSSDDDDDDDESVSVSSGSLAASSVNEDLNGAAAASVDNDEVQGGGPKGAERSGVGRQRASLEVRDSIALTASKVKQLGLGDPDDVPSPSSVSDVSTHAEEKKGEEEDYAEATLVTAAATTAIRSADEDDVTSHASAASGDTDVYGEKLTEKDRQAVMARLRLSVENENTAPPPEVATGGGDKNISSAAGTSQQQQTTSAGKAVKGILKHTSSRSSDNVKNTQSPQEKDQSHNGSPDRRSLFPSYTPRNAQVHPHDGLLSPESSKSVGFSPMARVVSVPSRHGMNFVDKAGVWWQRSDYDDFKKTGRIIAKAMLQGGSEIWLSSNNAWERRAQKNQDTSRSRSPEYDQALRRYVGEQNAGLDTTEEGDDYGSKWWCKFGHSRRGLEHIASMEEGRHRQRNVNSAIRHILDEQRSQRLNHRKDSVKLAKVALQYTSWARDLALAAGASDAEAVRTNFHRNAKDRGHYLRNINSTGEATIVQSRVPSEIHRIAPEILDANTSTHIYLQEKDAKAAAAAAAVAAAAAAAVSAKGHQQEQAAKPSATAMSEAAKNKKAASAGNDESGYETPDEGFSDLENVHDPDESHICMSKQAAGFNQHSDNDGMDIAFIHKKQEIETVGA